MRKVFKAINAYAHMQYDKNLIEKVIDEIRGWPQITKMDLGILIPAHSLIDFIADEPVNYPVANGTSTECRFKGIINAPRSSPFVICLYSDTSEKPETIHTLTIAHSLDVRANQGNIICKAYTIDFSQATRLAELHRRFYELQDPNHIRDINKALEIRELGRQYAWQRFNRK